jgi:Tfp pilus assembly protein PilF
LAVGQVSQAQRALDQALEVNPASAPARALKAIIAVTQNDELMALALAKEAIQSDPDSAAGYLALSYAQQAAFQLDEALDSVQQAMARDSDNALAKGRLAELLLAQGKLDEAVDVAEQAAVQTPDLAHTQTVLGFAYLSRIDTDRAKGAFERAIALDQAAPLPRLGLGLAQIRESDLEDGRTNIETAVALDPLRSLYRSYLGKAYFEEKRDALAADQYALAKQLDPMDPTPWLYDAILKQTQNRPVEALEDIQQSIALNDNRAVYRSRLLLDEDLAARGTSLARIYDDLGFEQLAVTEASRSLSIDPGNHSAHRFLADAYATRPRHEIARVSELLQSQLLQPVNLRPVQPSLAVVDLNLLADDSSSQTALNEYTTLFEREQLQLTASGLAGNNETWSDEVIFSGLFDRASFSFGQFHSETDGFRDNNDVENDIYNVFAQFAISPSINLQAEYRKRETSFGDLGFFLDRENFDPKYEYQTDHDVARIGLNFATSSLSDALLSITYSDRDVDLKNFNGALQTQQRQQGLQIDGQYLTKWENLSSILGYLHYNFDASTLSTLVTNSMILTDTKGEVKQNTFYVYNNFRYPSSVIWTIGLSYDSYNDGEKNLDLNELNPKFGAYWFPTDRVQFRFAYFETLKRRLVANETLEPTQIAGFNQFFDDTNGTVSKRLGIGADFKLANTIQLGAEVSRRDLDTFFTLPDGSTDKDLKDEELYRVYLFWTPNPSWAINFEYAVDNYKNDDKETVDVPVDLETSMVLMGIRHFRQNGLFLELRLDHIWQDIVSREQIGQTTAGPKIKDDSSFFVFDASVGYRLPRRRGVVTLEINNIFDKQFNFISNNFRSTELKGPRYIPSRSVFLRAAFHF